MMVSLNCRSQRVRRSNRVTPPPRLETPTPTTNNQLHGFELLRFFVSLATRCAVRNPQDIVDSRRHQYGD